MKLVTRIFKGYKLKNVFTPSTIARLTYVERIQLEKDLRRFVELPGMQIVLYGHSGCGKSTIINNLLDSLKINKLITPCDSDTTLNDIILNAFDKLDVYYTHEKTNKENFCIKNELKAKYHEIGASISTSSTIEESNTSKRILPIRLTTQRLAEFMGAANCYWIIEDFHKVSEIEKRKIADVLKIFVDTANIYPNVKIICIGAVGTARELVQLDSNLSTRVAEVYIPLLKDVELGKITDIGFDLLNVKYRNGIKEKIIYYSNNIASVCHQICYDICCSNNRYKSRFTPLKIKEEDFKDAVSSFVRKNSDTYTSIYDKICTDRHRKNIIVALIKTEKEFVGRNELFKETKKIQSIPKINFVQLLEELTTTEYEETIRFDRNSKKFSFSSPLFQTFVKMKIALEELEQEERKRKKTKRLGLATEVYAEYPANLLLNEKFLENYYQELDTYFLRRIMQIKKLKEHEEKIKKEIKRNLTSGHKTLRE